jgi:gliding motility-associated-like protein
MRLKTLRLFTLALLYLLVSNNLAAQSNFTGLNGAVINLPCNQTCLTPLKIPHLKKPSDYVVSSIPYAPFAYVTPGGTEDLNLYDDDNYSAVFDLPFSFCFYDSFYKKAVIGSNGLFTFDETNSGCDNAYQIDQVIPYGGGTHCSATSAYYPRAAVMGIFSDLNPDLTASPADRKIEWRVEGTDPFRRFVVSFYRVGVFGNPTCGQPKPTTFQMVIYESTGYIEVFIDQKLCQPNSPGTSNAILGIQNWNRDKAVWAPGKNRTLWTETQTGYRFTPSGSVSRFVKSELFNMSGTLIGTADTITTTAGMLDLNFTTVCGLGPTGQYVVKTTFATCDGGNDVVTSDTITVNKTNGLAATATFTQASCGQNDATITVNVPAGIGTPPISYSIDGGPLQTSNIFNGVAAGPHTIHAQDASNGCFSDVPVTVTPTGVLTVNYTVNNTSCNGASNGSINVTPPVGTAPITYTLNGVPSPNNVFNNLAPGNYTLDVTDAAGCQKLGIAITVGVGPFLTFTSASTPTSCPGANNGTITISNVIGGVGPYVYSINAGVYQAGNVFTNLPAAPAPAGHFILVKDLGTNCTSLLTIVPVAQGAASLTGTATATPTSCAGVNNGSIVVAPLTGSGPFEYSLNGTVWQTSNTFNGLAPGAYNNIRIREAGICTSPPISATIAAGTGLTAAATATPTSCAGVNNGSISVISTGTAPFTFVLDGTVTQTSATANTVFNNLAPGPHSVTVTDAAGCTTTAAATATVGTGTGFIATFTSSATSCAGANNGILIITPQNPGTAPFTFVLTPGNITQTGATTTYTGLAPGTYSVLITDANGCQYTLNNMTITAGGGLVASATSTPTTCAGVNNGTITVTTNGTAPFTMVLDGTITQTSATTTHVFNNVGAGVHSITITDATGCVTTAPVTATVTAGTGFTAAFTAANTSCAGVNNGSLIITPQSPGAAPFTFVLTPGNITQTGATTTFNNLAPATYSVLITDASGCQYTLSNMTITAGGGLVASATSTPTTCAGVNNGTITVTTNGTAPFTMVLDGTVTQTSATTTHVFNNVGAGAHSITITDATGCVTTAPVTTTVTAGTGFTAAFTAANTSCAGVNNGSLIITPQSPGASPFTFVLTPGNITQTGATTTFNNLAPATYSVLITDASGCQYTLSNMTITAGGGLVASATSTPTTCAGVNNGTISVTTNGTAPFTFVLDGTVTKTSATNTTVFNNVGAGAHNITVTDAAGCITVSPVTQTVTAGTGYTATFAATPATCAGLSNGSLLITPQTPGTAPFTFVLTPGNITQTGATTTFSNLAPGNYNALITDVNGCQFTLNNMAVADGAGLSWAINQTSTTCAIANNGSLTVSATTGTAPYTFVLDGTVTQTGNPSTTFINMAAGLHTFTITDAMGCTATNGSATIAAGTGFSTNFIATGTACVGVNNGSIQVTPQAPGGSPYTFVLNPGNVTQTGSVNTTFTGLAPNNYNIAITDANGCQSSLNNITVTQGAGLLADLDADDVSCFGAANGSITVTPTNGGGPYTFVLNPGAVTQTGAVSTTFTNLPANNYTITITDGAGCVSAALSQAVSEPAALAAVAPTVQPVKCNGANNGVITAGTPAGGTPPYTYSLDNVTWQSSPVFNVAQGNYTVFVRDSKSCVLSFPNTTVAQPAALNAVVANTGNATCSGGPDGSIQVTANGGTAPYQYSSDGANFQASNVLSTIAGTYTITVRDANNCVFNIPGVVVGQVNNLTLTATNPPPICEGTNVQLQVNSNGASYAWTSPSPNPNLSSTSIANPVASPTTTTQYTVTATLGNCTRTADVTVTVLPAPLAEAGPGGEICFGQNFQLHASGGVTYNWSPATYLNNSAIADPQVVKPDKTTIYSVTVTDANNCTSLTPDDVTVTVTPPVKIITSPVDTVVYAGATFQIQAISAATIYNWTPAAGMNNPGVPNPIVTAGNVGDVVNYTVIASTPAGCQGEAVVTVRVYTGPEIFMATAFTPNGDGKNDVFTPFPVGIKQINYFRVFNRWGNLVFATSGLHHGWDGKSGLTEQASGVYVWMIQGVTQTGQIINKQGTVMLIR